jgi:hypothetical protein
MVNIHHSLFCPHPLLPIHPDAPALHSRTLLISREGRAEGGIRRRDGAAKLLRSSYGIIPLSAKTFPRDSLAPWRRGGRGPLVPDDLTGVR